MKAALDAMSHDFASYRTGRASPAVLERVHVDYYGSGDADHPDRQRQRARGTPDPYPAYDCRWSPPLSGAILKSDLGINLVNDGTGIRLNFPR